jgi:succinate dehydrogenase/fumarate reductase cytochrome b subunit
MSLRSYANKNKINACRRTAMSSNLDVEVQTVRAETAGSLSPSRLIWIPAIAVLLYPWILKAFNWAISAPSQGSVSRSVVLAGVFLAAAFAVPLTSLVLASIQPSARKQTPGDIRARRFALLAVATPSAYVFLGVVLNMFKIPVADVWIWTPVWLLLALFAARSSDTTAPLRRGSTARLRVAHGICGAITTLFILFHLGNHLTGLLGAEMHEAVAQLGRKVYRAAAIEPILIAAMFFQVITGLRLAWTWSERGEDKYRMFQVASGVFLALFSLCHMNSVFIMARTILDIPTDYAFATGGGKMLPDPWAIRLLPHYALGVFFILAHLCSGLRVVMLAHGVKRATANGLWWSGAAMSVLVSLAIILGLTGVRLG